MIDTSIAEGFRFWRTEVEALAQPEKEVPYIPVIALVGVYAALTERPGELTSYCWRQTVLQNVDALEGLRQSLTDFHRDRLDDHYELSLDRLQLELGASQQFRHAHAALMDGMPESATTIAGNELFLAENLGYGRHDFAIGLLPLRLHDQGPQAFRSHYPDTAEFIEGRQ